MRALCVVHIDCADNACIVRGVRGGGGGGGGAAWKHSCVRVLVCVDVSVSGAHACVKAKVLYV